MGIIIFRSYYYLLTFSLSLSFSHRFWWLEEFGWIFFSLLSFDHNNDEKIFLFLFTVFVVVVVVDLNSFLLCQNNEKICEKEWISWNINIFKKKLKGEERKIYFFLFLRKLNSSSLRFFILLVVLNYFINF